MEGTGQGQAPSRAEISWNFPPGLSRQVGKVGIWDPPRPCDPPQNLVWGLRTAWGAVIPPKIPFPRKSHNFWEGLAGTGLGLCLWRLLGTLEFFGKAL